MLSDKEQHADHQPIQTVDGSHRIVQIGLAAVVDISNVIGGRILCFDLLLDGTRGLVLVAEEGTELLGMASLSFNLAMRYGGEYCQLEELVVDPAARGKKVGALLVEAAIGCARKRGCAEIGAYLVAASMRAGRSGWSSVSPPMMVPVTGCPRVFGRGGGR